jgi:hypothetical protein
MRYICIIIRNDIPQSTLEGMNAGSIIICSDVSISGDGVIVPGLSVVFTVA